MSKRKKKWILRSIQLLIALALMLSFGPAGAHLSGGYYHGSDLDWDYDNPDWMAGIPGYRRLSELSIPGTHDTGAHVYDDPIFDDFCQCQKLLLSTQLEAGIRAIDIRLARYHGALQVYHGVCNQEHTFEDVLKDVVGFLEAHRDETVIMNVQENDPSPFGDDNKSFIEMVEDDLQKTYHDPYDNPIGLYREWIWTPTHGNPTLDEVRGKIVIQDNFSQVGADVDVVGDVGMYTSLALDSAGKPHISYYDETNGHLKYAFWTGDFWWFAPVDGGSVNDVGQYTSIAMDEYDHPHISYYDVTNGDLKYAYGKNWIDYGQGWDWEISQVDGSGNDVGKYTSLALDYNDYPHISYYDATSGDLKYAFWTGDFWWFAPVDGGSVNDVGQYTSIALDDDDHPHISYYDAGSGDLKYAYGKNWIDYGQGWDWEISKIDYGSKNNVGLYTSLDLDSKGNPHISYYDNTSEDQKDLKYAFRDSSGAWNVQMLDGGHLNDVGQYSSIAIDKADHYHISYYDNTSDDQKDLKYAFWSTDQYNPGLNIQSLEVVGDVGQYTSIALDENNQPHISYYDVTNGDLKYAGSSDICGAGVSGITDFGLKICAEGHAMWYMSHDWELYTKKWPDLKAALDEADKAPRDRFFINGLNASNAVYPWFAASGHATPGTGDARLWTGLLWDNVTGSTCGSVDCYPDFPRLNCVNLFGVTTCSVYYEGMNELTLTYLNAHPALLQPRRWGIIPMDFPGEDLIDAIIKSNFPTMKAVYIPVILK